MKENYNIENIFKENFENFEVEPSKELWANIEKELFWTKIFKFQFSNLTYILSASIIFLLSSVFYFSHKEIDIKDEKFSKIFENKKENKYVFNEEKNNEILYKKKLSKKIVFPKIEKITKKGDKITKNNSSKEEVGRKHSLSIKNDYLWDNKDLVKIDILSEKLEKNNLQIYIPIPKPLAKYILSKNKSCSPLKVEFSNLSINADNYAWFLGDKIISKEKNLFYIFKKPGIYPITLHAKGRGGTSIICTDTVIIFENPDIKIEKTEIQDKTLEFYNYSTNAKEYLWNFSDNEFSHEKEPTHFFNKNSYSHFVILKAWSENFCVDSIIISNLFENKKKENLKFPNAFTVNLNGQNGGFYKKNHNKNSIFHPILKDQDILKKYSLQIFSRSGNLVYESKDINIGWDGYSSNRPAKEGTYIWMVKGKFDNGENFVQQGNVTIFHKKF